MESSPERKSFLSVPAAILVAGILVGASILVNGQINGGAALIGGTPDAGGEQPTLVENWEQYVTSDDPSQGAADAPITIVEFSDFECPYCQLFWSETYGLIKRDYIDTGKVRLVYRDYPLSFHPMAKPAAMAASCAAEQGKFWEYHDAIFANQQALSQENLSAWASQVGLDTAAFTSCLESEKYSTEVDEDITAGTAAGVSGTPSFIINGQLLVGALPYATFKAAIEAALEN